MKGVVAKDNWQNLCEAKGYEQGLEGGPDPAFPSLFSQKSRIPKVFIGFPNPAFLSQKNILKSLISTKANKCKK